MKTSKFVPLATIIGGFATLWISGFFSDIFVINESMFNAIMYSGLGGSAIVGGLTAWKGKKKDD